jgi:hypothetical protein
MSVIRADTVGPSAGGTTRSLVRGTAAAWVNFNGTGTIATRDSENVSSLTDNGTGDHTVNLSSAFNAADYAASGFAGNDNVNGTVWVTAPANVARSTWKQTGLMRIAVSFQNTLVTDSQEVCLTCHGDLA